MKRKPFVSRMTELVCTVKIYKEESGIMGKSTARKPLSVVSSLTAKRKVNIIGILQTILIVKHIELQPKYTLLEAFKIRCSKCIGEGKTLSPKTNRMNKE
ncbi:hypothetical protein [Peribacillus simplex]|uniref:hypothetical protein n=1 Tax=Peribacillus simplex TaxID=1478 RepID=UPI00119D93CB|nr:hypothetical protein [Peribacillus simplex]